MNMKDGFKSLEIEPTEGYLDFIGPAKTENSMNEPARVLKGEVRFILTKSVKIRNMSIKFKGFSHITIQNPIEYEISAPLLPKLKVPLLSGKTSLSPGSHVIPWEMDIPNIYPRSLLIKRATINYKVIVSISIGITKTLTAEYPIVIRRHLLPYKELAPIIETKLFKRTLPGKFHYEIDAPQIVCIEQEHIPMAIKFLSFANHKPVQYIRTRLIQIELYRRQSLSKSESDLSCSNRDSHIFDMDQKMADATHFKDTHLRYIKRTVPGLIHLPDQSTSAWKRPCLVKHRLHPYLSYTLDSPLVSIYHQLEITFQFGMKYEEVKAKIPIIIASIPQREQHNSSHAAAESFRADDMMMKYAFEEVSKTGFLSYKLESTHSDNNRHTTEDDHTMLDDDIFSIMRDTSIIPLNHSKQEEGTGRVTPMMFVDTEPSRSPHPPPPTTTTMPAYSYFTPNNNATNQFEVMINGGRRALSPTPEGSNTIARQEEHRKLKKFASALDLSTTSQESCDLLNHVEPIEERPRTTTPTMRRQHMLPRKTLQPINVDLANRKERVVRALPPPPIDLPLPPPPPLSSGKSDVLPAMDRVAVVPLYTTSGSSSSNRKNKLWPTYDDTNDDLRSIYSDDLSINSANAPSLSSSSATTEKSQPVLHSRPPSPVFSPAPGLPATIALRSQQEVEAAQIEEMFPASASMSPAMHTIASSTVLSPRTSYALRQRIALSTISSLTNDSLNLGSAVSRTGRSSSTVDPDLQSFLMMSRYSENGSFELSAVPSRYIHARLPPIPVAVDEVKKNASKRMTKIYTDDSEDEDIEAAASAAAFPTLLQQQQQQGAAHANVSNTTTMVQQVDGEPPRLPRLSFGGDFGISLGI